MVQSSEHAEPQSLGQRAAHVARGIKPAPVAGIGRRTRLPRGLVIFQIVADQDLGTRGLEGGAAGGKAGRLQPVVAIDEEDRLAGGFAQLIAHRNRGKTD